MRKLTRVERSEAWGYVKIWTRLVDELLFGAAVGLWVDLARGCGEPGTIGRPRFRWPHGQMERTTSICQLAAARRISAYLRQLAASELEIPEVAESTEHAKELAARQERDGLSLSGRRFLAPRVFLPGDAREMLVGLAVAVRHYVDDFWGGEERAREYWLKLMRDVHGCDWALWKGALWNPDEKHPRRPW